MQSIQNFAFNEHLVRVIERDGDPWFVGVDVCRALELSKPENALSSLDDDEKYTLTEGVIGDGAGRSARLVVSEPGVFRLVFRSRKPEAERFKRWLAHEVLPEIRKTGAYGARTEALPAPSLDLEAPLAARVDAVRLAARLFGRERARSLWSRLGLPPVPPASVSEGMGEARACLRVLLEHMPGDRSRTVRQLIIDSIDGDLDAEVTLRACGIRVTDDGTGFLVANVNPLLDQLYAETEWARRAWRMPLRRLEGASSTGTIRFMPNGRQSRATFLPLDIIDEGRAMG